LGPLTGLVFAFTGAFDVVVEVESPAGFLAGSGARTPSSSPVHCLQYLSRASATGQVSQLDRSVVGAALALEQVHMQFPVGRVTHLQAERGGGGLVFGGRRSAQEDGAVTPTQVRRRSEARSGEKEGR
jgi:hypothetical protein